LLTAILSENTLANALFFKGGTYAAMRGLLPRFSIDLDFDLLDKSRIPEFREKLHYLLSSLGFTIDQESKNALQFFLKYQAPLRERNTLKLEITDIVSPKNTYETINLPELNLVCKGQTVSTMVANKIVASLARIEKNGHPAGRDFYDLHQFFIAGLPVNIEVVEERTGKPYVTYLKEIIEYIEKSLSWQDLYQDLNALLPNEGFKSSVQKLPAELILLLQDEVKRRQP